MRVVFLTTSYPRGPDDIAGAFVRDAVEHLHQVLASGEWREARFNTKAAVT